MPQIHGDSGVLWRGLNRKSDSFAVALKSKSAPPEIEIRVDCGGERKPCYDTESLKRRSRAISFFSNGKIMSIDQDLEKIALQEKRLQTENLTLESLILNRLLYFAAK